MNRYPIDRVESLATEIVAAAGAPREDAEIVAAALADADLHGTSTHGVSRLNIYIRRIQKGLIDPATSLVARGNIIAAEKAGRAIPEGWALDSEGHPTTDAAAALAGTVLAMAGYKGAALAMLVELFSGVLSGSAVGNEIGSMYKHLDRRQNVGHFFCLFDVAALMPPAELRRRVDEMIERIKACRRRQGVEEILVPGESSHRKAEDHRKHGIPIEEATLDELKALCKEYGITFELEPIETGD